jgi:hypothetical protein
MKRISPEFMAIPATIVGLGVLFLILFAADAGTVALLIVGAVAIVAIAIVSLRAMRRPRAAAATASAFVGGAPPAEDNVHRALLVVDDSCTTAELESLRDERARTVAFVVAPAVSSRLDRWTGDERAYTQAKEALDATVGALSDLGIEATGHIGSHDPLQAADDGLREFPADEVVFVLHGSDEADWLEQHVVELGRERYPVPVREIAAPKLR